MKGELLTRRKLNDISEGPADLLADIWHLECSTFFPIKKITLLFISAYLSCDKMVFSTLVTEKDF